MPISKDLGLDKTAKALGLKRRFFGFESNRSLAARVVRKLGGMHPMAQLSDAFIKVFEPRHCVREQFDAPPAAEDSIYLNQKIWTFYYSDDTYETVSNPRVIVRYAQ